MFGKLELKWTEKYIHSSFKNHIFKDKYEIIDESEDTLIIKIEETFPNDELGILNGISYHVIQFEETRYHKYYSVYDSRWKYIELFQKVST